MVLEHTIQKLERLYGKPTPLAMLFEVSGEYYLFDTGATKLIQCTEQEYLIFDKIINGKIEDIGTLHYFFKSSEEIEQILEAIIALIQKENLFTIRKLE